MNWSRDDHLLPSSTLSLEEEILIKQLLLAHDPDGRLLDSEKLLQAIETVMHYTTYPESAEGTKRSEIDQMGLAGSQEPHGDIIHRISSEMLCQCSGQRNLHTRTLSIFNVLGCYGWDAKMVLVLAAMVYSYGKLCLMIQLYPHNKLATSLVMLRHIQPDLKALKPRLKALSLLIEKMLELTKCMFNFENLSVSHAALDKELIETIKSKVYVAAFWMVRSSLTGCSHMKDLLNMKAEQVHVFSSNAVLLHRIFYDFSLSLAITECTSLTANAVWELSSLLYKLSNMCSHLKRLVDGLINQQEENLEQKLFILFQGTHRDNQKALAMLFSLKDRFPLMEKCSKEKIGISALIGKVAVLLISKAEFLSPEEWLLLVHQTHCHPENETLKGEYDIIWLPILSSSTWTDAEAISFNFLSNCMPWYCIRRPHLLSPAVVTFIEQSWNYKEEPIMVVLDTKGAITNLNAIDMVRIWGMRAYPFSVSREEKLWEAESWGLRLLFDGIDQLLTLQMEEGKNICIYGSNDVEWIREFHEKVDNIIRCVQLEIVYVGTRRNHAQTMNISANTQGRLSTTKRQFFWLRLESMRRSKLRLGKAVDTDRTLHEVLALLDFDENEKGWAVFGEGLSADTRRLQGVGLMEILDHFLEWGRNVWRWGLLNAIKMAIEPPLLEGPCDHSETIPFEERLFEKSLFCAKCRRPMENFVVYK